jgi:NTE family protein
MTTPRLAIVLAGGAARGAYEVGVVQFVLEELPKVLGREIEVHILCGTSVGALNACALAAFAHLGTARAAKLKEIWTNLDVQELVKVDTRGIAELAARLLGRSPKPNKRGGGILDPTGIEQLIEREIPFSQIHENLRSRKLEALTISTTHVSSGRTVVFVERSEGGLPQWSLDPTIEPRAVSISLEHALASAAIPMIFRSVPIHGEYYCDGGLRQNVPLSPARRLGADGVLVINPRYVLATHEPATHAESPPGPFFVLGKALNALLLDRIDTDLARLESINRILDAGSQAYGAEFVPTINEAMGHTRGRQMRPLHAMLVRASEDIGRIAAEIVRSPTFAARAGRGIGRLMHALAERDDFEQADLLSYLLFDGPFARRLIDLGWRDAKARQDELVSFFERLRAAPARATE